MSQKFAIAAGGTGGHIFPALSVALEWKADAQREALLWIGTTRNREQELTAAHGIKLVTLEISGMKRQIRLDTLKTMVKFVKACWRIRAVLRQEEVCGVLAFGGYVSGPVLLAAWTLHIPIFLHEQNTVPGIVNRFFSRLAVCTYLGFPLVGSKLSGRVVQSGIPVRTVKGPFEDSAYPPGFDRLAPTVLICGGSQGAQSMNRCLISVVNGWLHQGIQVVWQTGEAGFAEVEGAVGKGGKIFVRSTIADLYPFYAAARLVVGRAGASTIAETAYFGLPCVLIPLPWSTEDHQWTNAGLVEGQGWGKRFRQDERCGEYVDATVRKILFDPAVAEQMSRKAIEQSPVGAAVLIVKSIQQQLHVAVKS